MNRTISGFIEEHLPYSGQIYGYFIANDDKRHSTASFVNEEDFQKYIRGLGKITRSRWTYRGFKDAERTELWKHVEDLNEV